MPADPSVPAWFLGVWKLEWIRKQGEPPADTRIVRDIQTPIVFGSVRIPRDRPSFPHATSLADLTDPELAGLLAQQGFSGSTSFEGLVSTWRRDIDYQPPGDPDIGRLERVSPSSVYEHALDDSFTEYWWSLSSGDGKFLGVKILRGQRADRILSVAGDHFVFARNRAKDLPPADSLADLVAKTRPTRETLLEYLDCELSYGLVRGGRVPWEIRLSTLPWKEGRQLELASQIAIDPATGTLSPRGARPSGETWTYPVNTMTVEDLKILFGR